MAVNDLITVGATPLVVQAYWAAGGSDWFGDARARRGAGRRLEARLRHLRRGLGRRRDTGAGRHRRARPHRPGRRVHRRRQPEDAAVARRRARPRRRHRAARLERHPRQRPEPGAQAGRAPAAGLSDADDRRAAVPIRYGEALLAPTLLYSPVTEALAAAGIVSALRRQHHRPRLAQAAAPPGRR